MCSDRELKQNVFDELKWDPSVTAIFAQFGASVTSGAPK